MASLIHERLTLELDTDVAEWCPAAGALSRLLAVGTYQLDNASGQREGRLHLYQLQGPLGPSPCRLSPCGGLPGLPGVFDLRWHPRAAPPRPLLAAALADGSVRVLGVDCSGGSGGPGMAAAVEEVTATPAREGSMAVSLDYSRCSAGAGDGLVASYSCGAIQLFQTAEAALVSTREWRAHDLEAWVAATDHWSPDLIYSGGDDCAFKLWDARGGGPAPAWGDGRTHGAGVCCVASSPHREHVVVTGSYDEKARLWDLRAPSRPVLVAAVAAGGGVWRLKWHPSDPALLLAACMHGGFALLSAAAAAGPGEAGAGPGAAGLSVVEVYPEQQTLAYGADWCREVAADGTSVVATASFYDRQLHVWSPGRKAEAAAGAVT